jgi:ABC-2 type transport system permease protein
MNPAETVRAPDFWEQWKTILWLRWRLSRNQWRRRGLFDRISYAVLVFAGTAAVLVSALGGFLAGYLALADTEPASLRIVDGITVFFCFFWIVGLLTEIQRSENLDIAKLLHLPVSLGRVFFFNYASSWLVPSVLMAFPGLLCLSLGLALSRGPLLLGLIPAVTGFFFLVTSITYLLRGWLVAWMSNERRRRTVLVCTTLLAVAFFQLPNLYFNVLQKRPDRVSLGRPPSWLAAASVVVPPLWMGAAAEALAHGKVGPAIGATAGGFGLGTLALLASYGGSLRALRGTERARVKRTTRSVESSTMVERNLRFFSPEVAAVAWATLRSHLRAPEIKMALFGQVVMTVVFTILIFRPGRGGPGFFESGAGALFAMLVLMGSAQVLFNQFGFDRDGFRSHILAPIARKDLLLGKTLAAFPLVAGTGFFMLVMGLVLRFLTPPAFVSATLTLAAGYFLFSVLGNWLSIIAPYKIAAGSLKPTKVPPRVSLILFGGLLLSPVAGAVMFLPTLVEILFRPLLPSLAPYLNMTASALLLGVAIAWYVATGPSLGRLLERREKDVLAAVTREIE